MIENYKNWKKEVSKRICSFGGGIKNKGEEYAEEIMNYAEEYGYAEIIYKKEFSIAKSAQKIVEKYTCQKIPIEFFKK